MWVLRVQCPHVQSKSCDIHRTLEWDSVGQRPFAVSVLITLQGQEVAHIFGDSAYCGRGELWISVEALLWWRSRVQLSASTALHS